MEHFRFCLGLPACHLPSKAQIGHPAMLGTPFACKKDGMPVSACQAPAPSKIFGLTGKLLHKLLRSLMAQKPEPKTRRWPYVLAALAILSAVFFFSSRERLVDPDEGAYLLAAKLVMEGKSVYTDFFWPQMPLLPYAYGFWMKIAGTNWYAARYFSGLLGMAMGLLLFFHVARLTGKQTLGLLAVLLFAFSSFSICWFSTAKAYTFSTFLLFAAYLFLFAGRLKDWKYLLAGFFLGLAVSTRLYFIGLVPLFLWLAWREERKPALLGKHVLGLLLGLVPSFFFLLKNPDNFYFDNVGYHFLRDDFSFWPSLRQKFEALPHLVGWGLTEGFVGLQFAVLLLAGAYFFRDGLRTGKKCPPSLAVLIFLLPCLFVPSPTHLQYFSAAAPFLVVSAVLAVHRLAINAKKRGWPGWPLKGTVGALLFGYGLAAAADFHRYSFKGQKVPGIVRGGGYAEFWKIPNIQAMARLIDQNITAEGESVMSFWPGYLLESKASIFGGMENHSNMVISTELRPADREKYRIISNREIYLGFLEHKSRLVILTSRESGTARKYLEEALQIGGFVPILKAGAKEREVYKWSGEL